MEVHNYRQSPLLQDTSQPNSLEKQMSSESSDSSISSVLLSMCPMMINDYQCPIRTDAKKKKVLQKISDPFKSYSPRIGRKVEQDTQSSSENESNTIRTKPKRVVSYHRIMDFLNREPDCEFSTCLSKLLLHPKIIDQIESKPCPVVASCVSTPAYVPISPERIAQCKHRQTEFDRAVEKLLEAIKYEMNKKIKQISKYWSYIKQIALEKYQPKGNSYQLFDYLLKSAAFNREYELFFEQNDEITAALQVLSTTLSIVSEHISFPLLDRSFDEEERLIREQLQSQSESLLASYTDELSFMRERIRFYQSTCNGEKDFDWMQIIQVDYPYLIEKISNDFLIEIPRIERILLQLLGNTKKHLLIIHAEIDRH